MVAYIEKKQYDAPTGKMFTLGGVSVMLEGSSTGVLIHESMMDVRDTRRAAFAGPKGGEWTTQKWIMDSRNINPNFETGRCNA